jgi:hypothetical protein
MVHHLRAILRILALGGWPPPNKIAGASNAPSHHDHKGPKARLVHQPLAYGPRGPGGRGRWGGLVGGGGWRGDGERIDDNAYDVRDIK